MPLRMSGLASGMDTESIVSELMKAQRLKSTKIENKITTLEWKQEKWKDLNAKIYSLYTGALSQMRREGAYLSKKATSSNEAKLEVKAGTSVPEGNHSVTVTSIASAQYITGNTIETTNEISYNTTLKELGMSFSEDPAVVAPSIMVTTGGKNTTIDLKADMKVGDLIDALNKTGLKANFDASQKRFFITSKDSGISNAFSIKSADIGNPVEFDKLGLGEIIAETDTLNGTVNVTTTNGLAFTNPSDSIITYNGANIRSSNNNITVNGLTIMLKGTTNTVTNEEITISVTKDSQAIYDTIKSFVKSYNEVLKELNGAYDAETAKGYEPLTDEQKEAMTDDQIKKWEDKIKNSLLRRDTIVSSVMSGMRSIMSEAVKVNGKSYSLASFGINSVAYTEKGMLHINGDKEDALTASEDDKLMKAISENPEAVMEVFTTLTGKLYSTMGEQMKSTSLSSALTFYNDKEMKKNMSTYKTDLSDLETKLQKMEERYYRQFTAMEKAMSQMNSRSASLTSLLGMNQGQ